MMLITPTSVQMTDPPEKMKERKEKNGYRNGTTYTSLETQVKYDPKVQGLMRTPSAMDARNWEGTEYTGGGTLAQEVVQNEKYKSLLPTPTVIQGGPNKIADGKRVYHEDKKGGRVLRTASRPCGGRTPSDSTGKLRDGDCVGHGLQPRRGSMPEHGDSHREDDAPHANGTGREEPQFPGRSENQEEDGAGIHDRVERFGPDGSATDPDLQRFNERLHPAQSRKEERFNSEADREWGDTDRLLPEHRWDSFPTVSPVHRGNDGIPFPLDNLTIPQTRWRFESLKAYGNAIVPQVMYRIFQAIEFAEANSKTDINF